MPLGIDRAAGENDARTPVGVTIAGVELAVGSALVAARPMGIGQCPGGLGFGIGLRQVTRAHPDCEDRKRQCGQRA